jgi:hypothetical protein
MIRIRGKHYSEAEVLPPQLRKIHESIDWLSNKFSLSGLREALFTMQMDGTLREAHAASSFGQLLRAGVQTIALDYYNQQPKSWDSYAGSNASQHYQEVYAPLYGSEPLSQVGYGQAALESAIVGDQVILTNKQFAAIEGFEDALVDDDQTGQFKARAQKLGQAGITTVNFYMAAKFIGIAASLGKLTVGADTFQSPDTGGTMRGPWSKLLYGGTLGNRLQTYKVLDGQWLKQARATFRSAIDPLGVKITASMDVLLVSAMDEENAIVLTGRDLSGARLSPWLAQVPGVSGTTASATPGGAVGAAYAANPFATGLQPVVEKYLPDWAWATGAKGYDLIWQERKPLEIVQEVPNSGLSFTNGITRYAARMRGEGGRIGNRHWVLGNPGQKTVDGDAGVAGAF